MTTRRLSIIGSCLAALAVSGCTGGNKTDTYKSKAPEKITPVTIVAGQEAELFPVKTGNTWVYTGETTQNTPQGSRSSKSEVTFRVTNVVETPQGKIATIEVTTDGVLSNRIKWRVGPTGIYQISQSVRDKAEGPIRDVPFEPPVPIVPFPVKHGSEITATAKGIRPGATVGAFKSKVLVEGVQEVDTEMGRFSALSTTSVASYEEKGIKFETASGAFWAPKVGVVRYIQEIAAMNPQGKVINSSSILRLKSHTP